MRKGAHLYRNLTHGGYHHAKPEREHQEDREQQYHSKKLSYKDVVEMPLPEIQRRYGAASEDGVKFEGVNHVAFVSEDMAKTLWFYCEILGFRLLKTLELPNNGQHFFLDGGNNCAVAFFYFPDAPKRAPGLASIDIDGMLEGKGISTAVGSVNHVAFNVKRSRLREYRARVKSANVGFVSPILYHSDITTSGYSETIDENTVWESFYFVGPDGEYLEMTAQTERAFTPERDIQHKPAVSSRL